MAQQYFTLLTAIGIAKLANAIATGSQLNLTTFAVGDGNGTNYIPTETMISLKKEVYRGTVNEVTIDDQDDKQMIITAMIPANQGGWFVREVGIFDSTGDMIAVGNYPESYKPVPESGSAKDMAIKVVILVSNSAAVNISINPYVVIATLEGVQKKVSQHNTAETAHKEKFSPLFTHAANDEVHIHHATACTGTGNRYELVVPTLEYPLPANFVLTFAPNAAVLDNAVIVIRKSAATPNEQSTVLPIITNENEAIGADAFAAAAVIMLAVGGGRAFFKMGGAGKPPENWMYLQAITATQSWTVQTMRWYRFHIIGAGGTGGRGGFSDTYDDRYINCGGGGGGASGGGLAISEIYLKAGTVIPATITASLTSFGELGTALCGKAGSVGGDGSNHVWTHAGIGGAGGTPGGTASGGNIANKVGSDGLIGAKGIDYSNSTAPGGGGKGSPKLADSPYYSPQANGDQAGITLNGDVPTFGGGGGGGTGSSGNGSQGAGGIGAPGGIVIEIGA